MSMCHLDGSICKTDKASLLKILEKQRQSNVPQNCDVTILDGCFVLHLLKDMPANFGNVSKKFLQSVLHNNASTVILAFDLYKFPSIKDHEHDVRGLYNNPFCIRGPEQVRPSDFANELKNINFKEALINFFIQVWGNDHLAELLGNKKLYVSHDVCYKYEVVDTHVIGAVEK